MEALVLIFAEIILACLVPVFGVLGAIFGMLAEAILVLFGGSSWRRSKTRRVPEAEGKPVPVGKPLVSRKLVHWVAGFCAVLGVAGIAGSVVFFQPVLRYVLVTASEKAGMSVSYDSASGSLLGGHVVLEGLEMARADTGGLAFEMQVARAEADVDLFSLLSGTPRLVLGQVEGVEGFVIPPAPREKTGGLRQPRRAFEADRMAVRDVTLEIRPREGAPYDLVIESGEVAPFRSQLALFDLLFRSNLTAELAGQRLVVETREITEDGRETLWQFEDVDAVKLRSIVPRAPLTWIEAGRIDVVVSDRWSLSDEFIDMDWRVEARGLKTSVPEEAGRTVTLVAQGLKRYAQMRGGDVGFRYRLDLGPEQIEALRQGNLSQFWDVVLSGVIRRGVQEADMSTPEESAEPEAEKPKLLDRMKSIFKKDNAEE